MLIPVIDDDGFLNIFESDPKYRTLVPVLLMKTDLRVTQVDTTRYNVAALQADGSLFIVNDNGESQLIENDVRLVNKGRGPFNHQLFILKNDNTVARLGLGKTEAIPMMTPEPVIGIAEDIVISRHKLYWNGEAISYPVPGREADTRILCDLIATLDDDIYIMYQDNYLKVSLDIGRISKADVRYDRGLVVTLLTENRELYILSFKYLNNEGDLDKPKLELRRSEVIDYSQVHVSYGEHYVSTICIDVNGNLILMDTEEEIIATGMQRLAGSDPIEDLSWMKKSVARSRPEDY